MVPEHESPRGWRSWQRTCFGTIEALSGVGIGQLSARTAGDGVSIIVRFASTRVANAWWLVADVIVANIAL